MIKFCQAAGFTLFLCIVAEVLQQEDLTGLQGVGLCLSLLAVVGKLYGNTQAFAYAAHDVLEGEFGIHLFGTTQVGHDNEGTSLCEHLLEGGHGTADTGIVRDFEFLVQGNVEVYAYDGFLAFEVVLINELLHVYSVYYTFPICKFNNLCTIFKEGTLLAFKAHKDT